MKLDRTGTAEAVTLPAWAVRLAAAIELQLAAQPMVVQSRVRSLSATSPEEVEVVYFASGESELRGIRISADVIRSAPDRIRVSSVDELAFDIVVMGMCEPRPLSEFLAPDASGVRWLSMSRWLKEIT